jgi:hypothetical protein
MPRADAPEWKRRKEPILDAELQAAIDHVGGQHDPATGWYATLHYTGCESRDRAKEIKRALYRSAYHLKVSLTTRIFQAPDKTWTVEFTPINKQHGRDFIAKQSGGDPSKLAYNPYTRNQKAE